MEMCFVTRPTPDHEPEASTSPAELPEKTLSQIGSEMAETWRQTPKLNRVAMGCLGATVLLLHGVGLMIVLGL